MRNFVIIFVLFFFCFVRSLNDAPNGKKVLVIIDRLNIKATHSLYFKFLEDLKYELTFAIPDKAPDMKTYGEWNFEQLILFTPSSSDLGIDIATILDFIDTGHSVVMAGSSDIGDAIKEIATECNVEFDEAGTSVIDHMNYDTSDTKGSHTLIVADNIAHSPVILGKIDAPILFRGVGQDVEEDSALLLPLLTGSSFSYSFASGETIDEYPHTIGKKTVLVSALQARNNARVIFSGSLDLFSDQFFKMSPQKYSADGSSKKYDKSGNENFCKQMTLWAFKEKGHIRYKNVQHHRVGETEPPEIYTIKENIEYSIQLEEWNGRHWVPYIANDVQLEFVRIDPHIRTTLKPDNKGRYAVQFMLPDVYGVFTFKIEYKREGYSFLTSITRLPVRPFRHNQYDRFIEAAYPYYASAFSMMAGLFVFSWIFLYHRDK